MILTSVLIAIELGVGAAFVASRRKNSRLSNVESNEEGKITNQERTDEYTLLFTNLGLMKKTNGDWIRCHGVKDNPYYKLVTFSMSDTLLLTSFQKKSDDVQQKMKVSNLEVFGKDGKMYFRIRKDNLPLPKYEFCKSFKTRILLGRDIDNHNVFWDTTIDAHCGIYANTGSGKSRLLHSIILNIMQNDTKCKLYLIDFKRVEFSKYKNCKNVAGLSIEMQDAKQMISDFKKMAEDRFKVLEDAGYSDYNDYVKDKPRTKMSRCYLVIDEVADFIDDRKANTKNGKVQGFDVVGALKEIARKVRACGIHICVATQRPTADFVDPSFKANLGCIIGMKTMNQRNSDLILDRPGLEKLEKSQAIAVIGSKEVFFLSFNMDNETLKGLIAGLEKSSNVEGTSKDESKIENDIVTLQEVEPNVFR